MPTASMANPDRGDALMRQARVIINVYGGLVQDVYADGDLQVAVIDWDTEGVSPGEDGTVSVPQSDERRAVASVCLDWPTHPISQLHPDLVQAISQASRDDRLHRPSPA